ncbi:unnamed protein product [Vicia faba]|uniref:Uncharacterized protein n=1 Tax=Vicia faba TaxID=3906 RepID=A0AAV1A987_VICFA|nr:unnamed protein product [Vicia faba]
MASKNNMKFDYDNELTNQYNTPHKLSLPRPCFPSDAPTPPPRTTAISVPFKWEEAPGKPKPRPCDIGSEVKERDTNVARALELPPRLLLSLESNINAPSPTTVLEGPYVGRAVSFTTSYRDNNKESVSFGSSRWGVMKKNNRVDGEGSFDFSSWSVEGGDKVKITRVRRRGSFSSFSHGSSHFLASIYGSFKQVVPWRRKQEKQQRPSTF